MIIYNNNTTRKISGKLVDVIWIHDALNEYGSVQTDADI